MTKRVLTPQQLPQLASTFFANYHVIALTPGTGDTMWAVQAAWAAARAAASAGRQVLLIDLDYDGPGLGAGAGGTGGTAVPGIAEAFERDADLGDVAVEQSPGLHYIGRGAMGAGAEDVWSADRWRRLARGFASEGALLLLYAPPQALAALPIEELAVVVIAPAGYDSDGEAFPRIKQRLSAGAPLVAVIARTLVPPRTSNRSLKKPRRRSTYAGVAGVIGALGLGILLVWSRGSGTEPVLQDSRRSRAVSLPASPRVPADSLYYSVQVAAHNTLPQALTHASEIEAKGRLAVVTPVRLGTQGTWYRVLVEALPTARAADSLLQVLWREGSLERPQGTILRTVDAYRLAGTRDDVAGLRARGIPAYIVLAPDSTDQVYVGAFDLAGQAGTTDSILAAADLAGTLVRRTGSPP